MVRGILLSKVRWLVQSDGRGQSVHYSGDRLLRGKRQKICCITITVGYKGVFYGKRMVNRRGQSVCCHGDSCYGKLGENKGEQEGSVVY